MKKFILAAAAAVAISAAAAPASAATYNKMSLNQLVAVLQAAGVQVGSTSRSDVVQVGSGTFVLLTQCDDSGYCAEISFFQNFSDCRPPLSAVNTWNNTKKIPEASLNGDGTLHMEMWLSTIGATDSIITDSLGWFDGTVADKDYWGPWISRSGV